MLHYSVKQAVALQPLPRIKFQLNFTSKTALSAKQAHQIQVIRYQCTTGACIKTGKHIPV